MTMSLQCNLTSQQRLLLDCDTKMSSFYTNTKKSVFSFMPKTRRVVTCLRKSPSPYVSKRPTIITYTLSDSRSAGSPFEIMDKEDSKIVLTKSETSPERWYEQSRTNIKTNRAEHPYARHILDSSEDMLISCARVLMLGCGGGSIAHELVYHFPEVEVTVVDSNSDAILIAKELIGSQSERIRFIHENAYDYMQRAPTGSFNVIINDVFDLKNGKIPHWTTDKLWLEQVKRCLKSEGSYMQNIIAETHEEHLHDLEKAFNMITVMSGEENQGFRNIVYMCMQIDDIKGKAT